MDDNNSNAGGLGWFLAGLGLGAIAGVLYAPKSGRETRDDLVNSAMDAKDRAAVLAQQGMERANVYVDQGKQAANEYVEKGRSQWTEYVEKGKNLVQDQQGKLQAAVDAGKDAYVNKTQEHTN